MFNTLNNLYSSWINHAICLSSSYFKKSQSCIESLWYHIWKVESPGKVDWHGIIMWIGRFSFMILVWYCYDILLVSYSFSLPVCYHIDIMLSQKVIMLIDFTTESMTNHNHDSGEKKNSKLSWRTSSCNRTSIIRPKFSGNFHKNLHCNRKSTISTNWFAQGVQ